MTRLLERLSNALTQLPGIGRKTAQRISFHILKMPAEDVRTLAEAITEAREKLRFCSLCFNLTEQDMCEICRDPGRDRAAICVVETPSDIVALERSREFRGLYHVLGGALSPLDDIGPEDLKIKELMARLENLPEGEVIIATNPTTEGEATAAYLARLINPRPGIRVTRIARGLPIGSDLDLADEVTLARALEGRKELR
jgi:recombination protein RecR